MNESLGEALETIEMEWLLQREGVSYKTSWGRSGKQLNLRECPACHRSEWKVYVGAETGLGNCFSGSCSSPTFNKWRFIKNLFDLEGRRLSEMIRELAREQGWRPTIKTATVSLQDLNTLALPDSTPVWEMDPVPEYLARRGIFRDTAEHFSLHWSPDGQWTYLDPRGFNISQDYSNRILIPIFDLNGEMVSFQGRDVTGQHEQRYLFPPGFASAGAYLYNAVNVPEGTETLVIAEGVFDVIQTHRALSQDDRTKDMAAVGTFGMHLSSGNPSGDDQLGRLRQLKEERGVSRVVFLWDGERKAAKAAIEASLKLQEVGIRASVGFVRDGADPGSSKLHEIVDAVVNALPCASKLDAIRVAGHAKRLYRTE